MLGHFVFHNHEIFEHINLTHLILLDDYSNKSQSMDTVKGETAAITACVRKPTFVSRYQEKKNM